MRDKQRPGAIPDLKAETIAVLLHGWAAQPPAGVDPGPHGFDGGMLEAFTPGGVESLWQQHEGYLRQTAARWQWRPPIEGPDGRRRFWAEHLAAGFEG